MSNTDTTTQAPDTGSTAAAFMQAPGATGTTDTPKSDTSSVDLMSLVKPLTPEKISAYTKGEIADTKALIGNEKAIDNATQRVNQQYLDRMKRLQGAEEAGIDDIGHKWDAAAQQAATKTSMWEEFGSPAFVISMLASAFSGAPMNAALQAGGAAIEAINAGDQDRYNKAFNAWKENTQLAIKRQQMEHEAFDDAAKVYQTNAALGREKIEAVLRRFNDERGLRLLEMGFPDKLFEKYEGAKQAMINLQKATDTITEHDDINRAALAQLKSEGQEHNPMRLLEIRAELEGKLAAARNPWKTILSTAEPVGSETSSIPGAGEVKDLPYEQAFGLKSTLNWASRKAQDIAHGHLSDDAVAQTEAMQAIEDLKNHIITALTADLPAGSSRLKQVQDRVTKLFPTVGSLFTGPGEASTRLLELHNDLVSEMAQNEKIANSPSFDAKTRQKARLAFGDQKKVADEMGKIISAIKKRDTDPSETPWTQFVPAGGS